MKYRVEKRKKLKPKSDEDDIEFQKSNRTNSTKPTKEEGCEKNIDIT